MTIILLGTCLALAAPPPVDADQTRLQHRRLHVEYYSWPEVDMVPQAIPANAKRVATATLKVNEAGASGTSEGLDVRDWGLKVEAKSEAGQVEFRVEACYRIRYNDPPFSTFMHVDGKSKGVARSTQPHVSLWRGGAIVVTLLGD